MKKRVLTLTLALALTLGVCGVAAPKAAAVGPIVESNVPIKYVAIPTSSMISPYTSGRDGMFPCFDLSTMASGIKTVYVGLDGYIVRSEGAVGFQYSEGLVAVVNSQNKVGYMDNLGNLVIPYQFDVCLVDGDPFTGEFQNGTCPVYVKTGEASGIEWDAHLRDKTTSASYSWKGKSTEGYWQTIDRSGKVVSSDYNVLQVWDRGHAYCLDFDAGMNIRSQVKYPATVKITVNGVEYSPIYDGRTGHGYAGDPNLSGDHLLSDIGSFTSYGIVFVAEPEGSSQTGNTGSTLDDSGNNMGDANATYGQSVVYNMGYTIGTDNKGYLLIGVTNATEYDDEGDAFYVVYHKLVPNYTPSVSWKDCEDFLPAGDVLKIHYKAKAGETKVLWIPVHEVYGVETEDGTPPEGWSTMDFIVDTRFVLAQAETQEECAELTDFFIIHDNDLWSFELTRQQDANGVTRLAHMTPMPYLKAVFDEKLSYFTSQF